MIKITPSSEAIQVRNIKILLYGQPHSYKTSTAFTAEDPLLLDFDEGSYRSEFRKDTVQITSWSDIEKMTEADLKPYKSLCVDTVGRLLDALTIQIITDNPKLSTRAGALTLQGYGELKAQYVAWLKRILSYGKDVVLVAHEREDKKGDDLIVRPDIQGGSYGEVFKRSDSIGYMRWSNRKVILDFQPSDDWVGKNVAQFEPFIVPNFHQEPDFLAEVIADIKKSVNRISEEGLEIQAAVDEWRQIVNEMDDAKTINDAVSDSKDIENKPVQIQVKHLIANRAKELGLEWSKEENQYVGAE